MFDRTKDSERVALIEALRVLDPALGQALTPIIHLAAFTFKVPVAFVSVVGEDEQRLISRTGLDQDSTTRDISICSCTIEGTGIMEVEDLREHPIFRAYPMVTGEEQLRFYAGAPLITKSGIALGTICLMSPEPRRLTSEERQQLRTLARVVMAKIELHMSIGRREPVTGLPNRQQLESDIASLAKLSPSNGYTAAFIDVFDIESANDAGQVLGMLPVESLLRHTARRLQELVADSARVYHVGISRFAFILENADRLEVEDLLRLMRSKVKEPVLAANVPMQPQFHAGLCEFHASEEETQDVTRKCLVAMNHAIQIESAYCWYSEERSQALQRRYKLASDAAIGLERDEFSLVFQPRYHARDLSLASAEALLRWHHPTFGPVSPAEFIPVLERTALIRSISRWVTRHALERAHKWQDIAPGFGVSLNLSPRDFDDENLAASFIEEVKRVGLPPHLIEVEITEGEWLTRHAGAFEQLSLLSEGGVKIAIDDFGSGYSNFAYLNELPISIVKIDRSLITGLSQSSAARLKVETVIRLARELGYRTIAEGVEHLADIERLQDWGCDELQGYALARPMPSSHLSGLLATTR